jgi:hypothetical protein
MLLEEVCKKFVTEKRSHSEWRIGQTFFNCLYMISPDVANEIRGTKNDPFNNDSKLANFFECISCYSSGGTFKLFLG